MALQNKIKILIIIYLLMPLNATIAMCVFALGTGAIAHRQNFRHLDRMTSTDNILEELSDSSIKNHH